MTNPQKEKVAKLNENFKQVFGHIMAGDDVDEKNWPLQVLGHRGKAEWALCSAYIDWYVEMYDEIDEFYRYDEIIIPAMNDFLERYRKNKECFDIVTTTIAFEYVLGLLAECRIQTLARIECKLLKKGIDKMKKDKKDD